MEMFFILLGIASIYSVVHLGFLQGKAWDQRTAYEKVVTAVAFVVIALLTLNAAQ